jgi:hypothetical protein
MSREGVSIPVGTKCEIQITTLLQHSNAELSHDTVYKSSITSQPEFHRLFAKSMAVMETTDDMLLRANQSILTSLATVQAIKDEVAEVNASELSGVVFEPKPRENYYIIDQLRGAIRRDGLEEYGAFLQKFANVLKAKIEERRGEEQSKAKQSKAKQKRSDLSLYLQSRSYIFLCKLDHAPYLNVGLLTCKCLSQYTVILA